MPQEKYTLSLINQAFNIEVQRTVFDSKKFTIRPYGDMHSPVTRQDRKRNQISVPLYEDNFGLNETGMERFDDISRIFDKGKIRLVSLAGKSITVTELRDTSKSLGDPSVCRGLEKQAQKLVGESYTTLLKQAQERITDRFKAAFQSIVPLHPMDMSFEESEKMRENFTHYPVWTPPEVLQELRDLADQGHAYSQYLSGVLLATIAGEFSTDCIEYLIAAYKQKVPDAMTVLAEYCFLRRDYFGATQCALLAVDGGYKYATQLIQKCFALSQAQVYEAPGGIRFGSQLLTAALRESGFEPVMKRVIPNL